MDEMDLKARLAALLSDAVTARGRPVDVAATLGMSRQRLHQLKSADRTAAPQAIVDAIEALGYAVTITADNVSANPTPAPPSRKDRK